MNNRGPPGIVGISSRAPFTLWVFLAAAAFYFTANINHLSLLSGDDCYYARKGVEMLNNGGFFTVTWNGNPTFQNPPLLFWFLARSFEIFGERDFAARLPTVLMALGLLIISWRIGLRTVGPKAAVGGVGLLLVTPLFLEFSRRCMMEVPNAFWVSLVILAFLEGYQKPQCWLMLSIPLAGALLTKSLLGLMPVGVVILASLLVPNLRQSLRSRWFWAGIGIGVLGGAAWPLHQGWTFGWHAVKAHYVGEIGARAAGIGAGSGTGIFSILGGALVGYPGILLKRFQPVIIPGLVGTAAALLRYWSGRGWHEHSATSGSGGAQLTNPTLREKTPGPERPVLLAVWVAFPIIVFSFSAALSARYLFPLLVPLALLGAWILMDRVSARVSTAFSYLVAVLLVGGGLIFWISPHTLTRDMNASFKHQGPLVASLLPEGRDIPLLGEYTWGLANPLLYYCKHAPRPVFTDVSAAVRAAERLPRAVLVVDETYQENLRTSGRDFVEVAYLREWVVVEFKK